MIALVVMLVIAVLPPPGRGRALDRPSNGEALTRGNVGRITGISRAPDIDRARGRPQMARRRPLAQEPAPIASIRPRHSADRDQSTAAAAVVVDLAEARAERRALDRLDRLGLFACWTSVRPRRCQARRWTA